MGPDSAFEFGGEGVVTGGEETKAVEAIGVSSVCQMFCEGFNLTNLTETHILASARFLTINQLQLRITLIILFCSEVQSNLIIQSLVR